MVPELPFDVLSHISAFVTDIVDLCNISLANSVLYKIATSRLYADVCLRDLRSLVLLQRSLERKPALGQKIRNLDLKNCALKPSTPEGAEVRLHRPAVSALARLLHRTLRLVGNLHGLVFPVRSWLWDPQILRTSLSRTVKSLEIYLDPDTDSISLDPYMSIFAAHPQLTGLHFGHDALTSWRNFGQAPQFPGAVLPNLRRLCGPVELVNAVIVGSPTTSVFLTHPIPVHQFQHAVSLWGTSSTSHIINVLLVTPACLGPDQIKIMGEHLPHLESLMLLGPEKPTKEVLVAYTTAAALDAFKSMRHLVEFCLLGFSSDTPSPEDLVSFWNRFLQTWPDLQGVLVGDIRGDQKTWVGVYANPSEIVHDDEGMNVLWRYRQLEGKLVP